MRRCLESLAAVRYPSWDVVVVDQSDNTDTEALVASFATRLPNVRHLPMAGKGASRSRNAGVEASTGEYIAFIDDDCTVEPSWLEEVANIFSLYPQTALVYGRVIAGGADSDRQWTTVAEIARTRVWQGRLSSLRIVGIGANMQVRRSAFNSAGRFDVHFGPGSGFAPAGEEEDLCYRFLARGHQVVETPAIVVRHYGARDYASGDASRLLTGYAFSGGALVMKLLRAHDSVASVVLGVRLWQYCTWVDWRKVVLLRRSSGLKRLVTFLKAMRASFGLKVDRRRCLYASPRTA
jgi:glycosyltransferase involved in cell wall biosynthesis